MRCRYCRDIFYCSTKEHNQICNALKICCPACNRPKKDFRHHLVQCEYCTYEVWSKTCSFQDKKVIELHLEKCPELELCMRCIKPLFKHTEKQKCEFCNHLIQRVCPGKEVDTALTDTHYKYCPNRIVLDGKVFKKSDLQECGDCGMFLNEPMHMSLCSVFSRYAKKISKLESEVKSLKSKLKSQDEYLDDE